MFVTGLLFQSHCSHDSPVDVVFFVCCPARCLVNVKTQLTVRASVFGCAVMLVGILVSCSHGRANPTDMLAKVHFNKIAEEKRREEKRREEKRREETRRDETRRDGVWSVWCMLCGVCAQVHHCHVFFACDGGGAVDFPQRVIFFIASHCSFKHCLTC